MGGRYWLKPCRTNQMTPVECAWLAGFFDGEGSIIRHIQTRSRSNVPVYGLQVPNTHLAALERCKTMTGVGSIITKKLYNPRGKPCWNWRVYGQRDVMDLLQQMKPHLTVKLRLANECLAEWRALPVVPAAGDTNLLMSAERGPHL